MGSYSTLIKQLLLFSCIGLLLMWIAPNEAKVWVCALLVIALALFAIVSILRHRQIMHLAHEIDEVLHSGRKVDLSTYRESDVAVLSNELTKMVARLSRMRDQLEEERNALSDSLADVSHQIRTPLTAAGLMLPIIERAEDKRERIRCTRELEVMLDRVSWLVTSLLKIAKVDAGAIHLEKKNVNAADIARNASIPLVASLDLHDIDLVFDVDEKATFTGDAMWTTEALENIIKNCMEHTPSGGSITINVYENAISSNIRIQDTGPGISDTDLPHIFERFYRGRTLDIQRENSNCDPVTEMQSQPAGFGIGLALAKALISAQGGTLRACNSEEGGARFDIAFPKLVV